MQGPKCVVELGAGTGPITKELVRAAAAEYEAGDRRARPGLLPAAAAEVPRPGHRRGRRLPAGEILADRGIAKADHVISGLPLPSFPPAVRDSIIRMSARVLGPDGEFRQITNMPWVYLKLYKSYFRDVSFKLVPLNLPPGGVYFCKGYQPAVA